MSDYKQLLNNLIKELSIFIDDAPRSPGSAEKKGGYEVPEPIEDDWPKIYQAVKDLEQYYDRSLPRGALEHWYALLTVCRETGDDADRGLKAFVEANDLLDWAKSERENQTGIKQNRDKSDDFLNLDIDVVNRRVKRGGEEADFRNNSKAWKLFLCLFEAEDKGCSRDDLMKAIYGDESRIPNVLDQHKRTANDHVEKLRIEISSDQRGVWKLSEFVQSKF